MKCEIEHVCTRLADTWASYPWAMGHREDLQGMLDRLDTEVAAGLRDNPDPDAFWPTFATQSNIVLEAAGSDDFDWVSSEISVILARHGIPVPEA